MTDMLSWKDLNILTQTDTNSCGLTWIKNYIQCMQSSNLFYSHD